MTTARMRERQVTLSGRGVATAFCFALAVLLVARIGAAEQTDSVNNTLVMELLRKIEQRDAAIRDLQRRVGELERQRVTAAGERPATAAAPASKVPTTASAGAAPARPFAARQPASEPPSERKRVSVAPTRPAAAPGQFEIDEEAAVRALERTLVQSGVLLLPRGTVEVQTSLAYTRRELEIQRLFPKDESDFFVANQDIRRNIVDVGLGLRFGLPYDSQFEVTIPYRWVDQSDVTNIFGLFPDQRVSRSESGLTDIRLGLAKTLAQEERWWPDLVGRVIWDTDTGSSSDALGKILGDGFNSVTLVLSALKRQDPLAFIGDLSYRKTFEKDDLEPGDQFGLSLGAVLAASPETSLRFVFNQTVLNETKRDGREVAGSDLVLGNLTLGASTNVGHGTLLDVSTAIGVTDAAPDYALQLSLSKQFSLW